MSKGETVVQLVKIVLGVIALYGFFVFAIRVVELLQIIAAK